jgi:hypothetical protein
MVVFVMQLFARLVTRLPKTRISLLKIPFQTPGVGGVTAHLYLARRRFVLWLTTSYIKEKEKEGRYKRAGVEASVLLAVGSLGLARRC